MAPMASDLPRIHARIGSPDEVLLRRRAVYHLAAAMATGSPLSTDLALDVVDNPMLRGHVAEVLAGTADFDDRRVRSLRAVVSNAGSWDELGLPVRIASTLNAADELSVALRRIDAELGRNGAGGLDDVLVHEGAPGFSPMLEMVRTGIRLAANTARDLVVDLLPHVALLAVISHDHAGRLGSASVREFPGLVVLPEPASALEVAEALVHEGAHQKFFDLAIVGSVFGGRHHYAPLFEPSWAGPGAGPWPFEQVVAAFHAYCCLAAFWKDSDTSVRATVHDGSLLPLAADRAEEIGQWILANSEYLGRDGADLVGRLTGRDVLAAEGQGISPDMLLADTAASAERVAARRCGAWMLVMRWTAPVELTWMPSTSAAPIAERSSS